MECRWCGRGIRKCNITKVCRLCQETEWCSCGRRRFKCFLTGSHRPRKPQHCVICRTKKLSRQNETGYCRSCFARWRPKIPKVYSVSIKELKEDLPPNVIKLMELNHQHDWVSFIDWHEEGKSIKASQRSWSNVRAELRNIDAIEERIDEDSHKIWVRLKDHRGH